MKFAVIGGAGIQALGAIYDLLENPVVSKILVADIDEKKVFERVKSIGDSRLEPSWIDVIDEDNAAKKLSDYDVIINCGPAPLCPAATRIALKAEKNYVDLGAWPEQTREQLKLYADFEKIGITAVLGMGSAPGISNMMALVGVNQLDVVHAIDIIIAMRDDTKHKSPFVWPYALDTILDEYTIPPIIVRDGIITQIPPLTENPVDFDEPIGFRRAVYTIHPEPVTLFESFKDKGCKNTSFSIALPEDFHNKIKFLIELGFGKKENVEINDSRVSPRKMLLTLASRLSAEENVESQQHSATRVVVIGEKDNFHKEINVELYVGSSKKWNIPAGRLKTSIPLSITAQLLAKGFIKKHGVFPPELCVPQTVFFEELAKRGMNVCWYPKYYAF